MATKSKTVGRLNIRLGMNLDEFNKSMREFQREMRKAERQMQGFKILSQQMQKVGTALTASLTVPIVGLGYAAKKAFDLVDEGMDNIAIATGATGKELESLHESFKRVGREVPSDLAQIGSIIGDLNTYLGATGGVLEDLTKKIALATGMLKEDATGATKAISKVVNKWGLEAQRATKLIDQLFFASQKFGVGMTKIAENLTYFQVQLNKMGFSLEESIALLGHFERSGVNTEQILMAMSRAMATMAKAGVEDTSAAFAGLVEKIKNAKTESEAASIALKVFGARAGPQMAAEIRAGRFEIAELVREVKSVGQIIDQTFAETADSAEILAAAKNALTIALKPLGEEIDKLARTLLPPLIKGVATLVEKFDDLSQPVKTATVLIGGFLAVLGPGILTISLVVRGVVELVAAIRVLQAINWLSLFTNLQTFLNKWVMIAAAVFLAAAAISGIGEIMYQSDPGFWDEVKKKGFKSAWDRKVKEMQDWAWQEYGDLTPGEAAKKSLGEFLKKPEGGMSPKEIGEAFVKGAYKPLDYISNMIKGAVERISEATGGIKVPEPEIDLSGMSDELDKLLGDAGQKGKTAGEAFSEEFSKIWEELWEKPYNLGKLDTLEKQLNQLKYIESQADDKIRYTLLAKGIELDDDIWKQTVESSQAFAKVWDQIFDTQRKITEQQVDLIKAKGLNPDNIGKINSLIEELKPLAKTSRAKLDVTAMRSEFIATSLSDKFAVRLDEFNRAVDKHNRLHPDEGPAWARVGYEGTLYKVMLGEVIQDIKDKATVTLGTSDTPEIRGIIKAYNDRLKFYQEEEEVLLKVWESENVEQLDAILGRVAKLSRDELKKYWDEALQLAKSVKLDEQKTKIAEINKLFEERDRVLKIDEWYAALDDMAEVIGKFNREAGDSVRNFRDIATILNRMPEVTANIENSFAAIRDNINADFEPYLGKNYVGQLFGGAAGMQAFGQGSSGTNWIGAIAGTLAGAGFGGPLMGAIAVGAGLVNAIWPGKEKESGAENLKKQIDDYNEILKEWGAEYQSDNLSFKKDSGFLGWRGLFGNEIWETVGEEAARKGAEIAEQIIASMQQVFSNLASGAFDALFGFGGIDSLTKSVGQSLQNALMEAIISTTAIKEPMQRLSAYIAEAVQDGLTSAELEYIKNMTGELWNSLSQYEDIAKEIADQFGLAEESAKGIGAALRNVPQGFKIALERFTAATGNQISAMQGLSRGVSMESNRTQIIIQGDVYGLDDFERKVESAMDKSDRRRKTRNYGVWAGAY